MFKRRFKWFGRLVSDEGFSLGFGSKSVTYHDERGEFEFGFEDGLLFLPPHRSTGPVLQLSPAELDEMVRRVTEALRWDGHAVRVFTN